MASHLLRRGLDAYLQQRDENDDNPPVSVQVPGWVLVMLAATAFGFIFLMTMINYTFGRVIPTLLIIESPDALFEPLPTIDPDAPLDPNAPVEPELAAIKQEPVTSSFRKTLKLLQSKGGFTARFRGFSLAIVYSILISHTEQLVLPRVLYPGILNTIIGIVATVLLANLHMAWTHIIISEPSPKRWFRRLPALRLWKKIAIPAAIAAVADHLAVLLPMVFAALLNLPDATGTFPHQSAGQKTISCLKALAVGVVFLACLLGLSIPANVVLTRIEASLLSDAEETIVSFDRSFGGKVEPELVGGTGVLSLRDAWQTFDWSSRLRLVKAYGKVFALQILLFIAFVAALNIEFFLIARLSLRNVFPGNEGDRGDEI